MRRLKQAIRQVLGKADDSTAPRPAGEAARFALWSIGLYRGASQLALAPDSRAMNPIVTRDSVTDAAVSFVADPFLLHAEGEWFLFFEILNRASGRGEIALARSADLVEWHYERIVLAETFHLSYPQVFEWDGAYYMLPECQAVHSVRLYRATSFPCQWEHVHTLMQDDLFADSTLVRHDNRWWLFTQTSAIGKNDNLRLFFADDLFGQWTEHPASPLIENNPHATRPAGPVVSFGERLYRFAQDCAPKYGLSVNAFEITELTTATYAERPALERSLLSGSGSGWNASRMHHVDAHALAPGQWVAAVDGAFNTTMDEINGTLGQSKA